MLAKQSGLPAVTSTPVLGWINVTRIASRCRFSIICKRHNTRFIYVNRKFATKFGGVVSVLISFLFSILELTLAKHGNRQCLEFLLLSLT